MRGILRIVPVGILLAATACSTVRPRVEPEPANVGAPVRDVPVVDAGEAQTNAGCYECLTAARNIYARRRDSTSDSAATRLLFETELLLVLREKEIGLGWDSSLARARALEATLPASLQAGRVLEMVRAVTPDEFGATLVETATAAAFLEQLQPRIRNGLTWLQSSEFSPAFREYLTVAIECTGQTGDTFRLPTQRVYSEGGTPPLVQYRRAVCASDTTALRRVRAAVPRFFETDYFIAQVDLSSAERTGGVATQAILQRVYARFPRSSGAAYLLGLVARSTGECERALGYFEAAVALRPRHEHAHTGRTVCLTELKRHPLAIETASRMIELNVRDLHQAYYWRAVNHRAAGDLVAARADIESAKALRTENDVMTMAGVIEFEQNDINAAEVDLTFAIRMAGGNSNCTAAFFLGRVFVARERWPDAAKYFEDSMTCSDLAAIYLTGIIENMKISDDIDPAYKARRLAKFEQMLKENRSQQYYSAFNAANYFFRAGNIVRAREFLPIAEMDPTLAEPIAKLRAALGGG